MRLSFCVRDVFFFGTASSIDSHISPARPAIRSTHDADADAGADVETPGTDIACEDAADRRDSAVDTLVQRV